MSEPQYSFHPSDTSRFSRILDIDTLLQTTDIDSLFQEGTQFAQTLIETSQSIILILDYNARIVMFNSYFEHLTGYPLEEVQGQDWFSLFLAQSDQIKIRQIFQKILATNDQHHNTNPIIIRDGQERMIEWHNKTLKDAEGNIQGVLSVGRDITESKRFQDLLQIQRDIAITLSKVVSLEECIHQFLSTLVQRSNEIDAAAIYLFDRKTNNLNLFMHQGFHPDTIHGLTAFNADSEHAQRVRQGVAHYYLFEHLEKYATGPNTDQLKACGTIAVNYEGHVKGALFVGSRQYWEFPSDVRNMLDLLSTLIGGAVSHAQTLDRMQQSEIKYRTIYETSTDAMMLLDERGFFDCNQAALDMLGLSDKKQLIGSHFGQFSPAQQPNGEDSVSAAQKRITQAFEKGSERFRWTFRHPETKETFITEVSFNAFPLHNRQILQATVRNITDQIEAHSYLQKNVEIQAALNDLISLSLDSLYVDEIFPKIIFQFMSVPWLDSVSQCAIFLVDRGTDLLKLRSYRGLNIEQLTRYNQTSIDEFNQLKCMQSVEIIIENPNDPFFKFLRVEGEKFIVLPLKDHHNHFLGMITLSCTRQAPLDNNEEAFFFTAGQMILGLVQRKEAEEKFQSAYNRMDHLINSIPTILIAIDKNNIITQWNPTAEKLFNIPLVEAIHQKFTDCPIPWEWRETLKNIPNIQRKFRPIVLENIRFTRPDQKEGFLDLTITPIKGTVHLFSEFLIVGIDRTDQKALETQLLQSQKLESIGQLAAGIAHEINTPIQYVGDNVRFLQDSFNDISGILSFLSESLQSPSGCQLTEAQVQKLYSLMENCDLDFLLDEVPQAVLQSLDGVERVATIVRAMKGFAHPDASQEKVLININQGIENTVTVARNEWKYVADLETHLDPDLPLLPGLAGEINQVILNMIVNASHSIGDVINEQPGRKGKITISTTFDTEWVEIRIQDTGKGIPPEIQQKIFDPFFTTKKVGKGTGQGLAISHSVIVDKHQGSISLDSIPGQGTTFIIRLPIHDPKGEQNQ